jgi:anti-anti-sigma factor
MGQLRSALSAALLQGCGPAEALELLDLFASRLPGALASTAACLVVDAEAGTVRWARAGHPPPLVVTSDGQARFLDGQGSGTVLGVPGRAPYTEGSFTIEPGATLLLYTDGLAERRGEPLDEGLARVRDVAARHATADPGRLTTWLLDDVLADTDQPDDVAVIAARVLPVPLGARLLADPAQLSVVRRAVSRWSIACGLDDDLVEDLQLALGEALSNAVEHAYAGGGDGECTYSLARRPDGSVVAEVTDTGAWRPPPADKGYRGRGLELISALAQDVEVVHGAAAPGGTGTCVRFRFLPQDGPADEPARRPSRPAVPIGTADDEHEARVVESRVGAVVQLAVEGTLDIATVGTVTAAVAGRLRELPRRTPVLLDLSPTSYLASAGVGMVLELRARAAELGLTLRVRTEPGSPPDRILTLAGLADELQAR